ncbi:MAG: DUF853 family protein [Bacteroidetes bacterium]|nr:DUF853 family protein [Bacteroidota bacterium]
MSDKNTYIKNIQSNYSFSSTSIYLGAGVFNDEIIGDAKVSIPLKMFTRHGLVAGATGTGKTRTLQLLAEQLSDAGVPVFLLDVKGDLSGMAKEGILTEKIKERIHALSVPYTNKAFPVELLSLTGKRGAQVRATSIEIGPLLLSKILELNDTQTGALTVLYKYADDKNLPLLDLADIKKTLNYLAEGDGAKEIKEEYGKISTSTASTILRKIVSLEQQGVSTIFGEPSFDISDFFEKVDGMGVVSLLNISDAQDKPVLYSTFLLSLLVEIYQTLPEVGDLEKPKLVFFFDEAHLLFNNSSPAFLNQIEQIIRLIRSKGVGIFFCTQSPLDIPDSVLGQLGNRIQHALRAFTPNDADNLKKTAKTYPTTEFYAIEKVLTSMGIGQALVTVLNEKGIPTTPAVTHLFPPRSMMGMLTEDEFTTHIANSDLYKKYQEQLDSRSAHDILTERIAAQNNATSEKTTEQKKEKTKPEKSTMEQVLGSPVTKEIGKSLVRGLFGMLFGKTPRSTTRRRKNSIF